MLQDQGGVCAICQVAPAVHVDHDHATGAVRALLCFTCNGGLGQFRDDPYLLRVAAFYVEGSQQRQALTLLQEAGGGAPAGASRPGSPPVGSQRRPGRPRATRSTGRHRSEERRQGAAGEADG
ncbi:endonuclease VII domain-containing protein [Geodermatophilus sp. CPCC 205506]|uniref:endonuclease VII domain-containing protein n=1 Tax=Geodermatophilus sp. CPCC 205506 TaxID=2936596 RepID=UPI003EE92BE1